MSLDAFLQRSGASDEFRAAVERFLRDQSPSERIQFGRHSPAVKVERTITQLLASMPQLRVERVRVEAVSGCEHFRGILHVETADDERTFRFHWDCKWRAEQEGWRDCFGFADQARAAREFGYDCFRSWEEVALRQPEPA